MHEAAVGKERQHLVSFPAPNPARGSYLEGGVWGYDNHESTKLSVALAYIHLYMTRLEMVVITVTISTCQLHVSILAYIINSPVRGSQSFSAELQL